MERRDFFEHGGSSPKRRWLGAAFALVIAEAIWAVTATGCGGTAGAQDGCSPLPACGGDPSGNWTILPNGTYCQYVPPLSYTVTTLPPPQTMISQVPTPEPTPKSPGDDCSALVYEPTIVLNGHIKTVSLPHPTGNVVAVPLTLSADGEYSTAIQTLSNTTTYFSRACMNAYGANPTCAELGVGLAAFYTGMPNFSETFTCTATSDDGCNCQYTYAGYAADVGTWRTTGNIIYFFSEGEDLIQPVVEATYCVGPNKSYFSVSGRDGQSLFNLKGLRSFTLVPAPATM